MEQNPQACIQTELKSGNTLTSFWKGGKSRWNSLAPKTLGKGGLHPYRTQNSFHCHFISKGLGCACHMRLATIDCEGAHKLKKGGRGDNLTTFAPFSFNSMYSYAGHLIIQQQMLPITTLINT